MSDDEVAAGNDEDGVADSADDGESAADGAAGGDDENPTGPLTAADRRTSRTGTRPENDDLPDPTPTTPAISPVDSGRIESSFTRCT